MKPLITSVSELYERQEPWGEPILDAVADALRRSTILFAQDMALLLDADQRDLNGAMKLLTGMSLGEVIEGWRLRQVCELLREEGFDFGDGSFGKQLPHHRLRQIAQRCGWRDVGSLRHFLQRHRII